METILIADDEPSFRDLLTMLLEMRGCECVAVENGKEALKMLRERSFTVFLCDLIIGEMTGTQTMREARKLYPEMKIVAVSGAVRYERDATTGLPSGADAMLAKPFQIEQLMAVIEG